MIALISIVKKAHLSLQHFQGHPSATQYPFPFFVKMHTFMNHEGDNRYFFVNPYNRRQHRCASRRSDHSACRTASITIRRRSPEEDSFTWMVASPIQTEMEESVLLLPFEASSNMSFWKCDSQRNSRLQSDRWLSGPG